PWRKLLDGGTGNPPGAPDNVRTSARQRKSSAEARLIGNFGLKVRIYRPWPRPICSVFLIRSADNVGRMGCSSGIGRSATNGIGGSPLEMFSALQATQCVTH